MAAFILGLIAIVATGLGDAILGFLGGFGSLFSGIGG